MKKLFCVLLATTLMITSMPIYAKAASVDGKSVYKTFSSTVHSSSRLSGATRYDTAVAIAKDGWQKSDYAVIAYGEKYPDALAAVPLAKKLDAPILLTEKDSLTESTKQALLDLKVRHVIIVGGVGVVSNIVDIDIKALGIETTRLAGQDSYDTSVEIAEQLGNVNAVAVCNGDDYSDALSIGSVAGKLGMPILLVSRDAYYPKFDSSGKMIAKNSLPDSFKSYFTSHPNIENAYVINLAVYGMIKNKALDVVSNVPNVHLISGAGMYETNLKIIDLFKNEYDPNVVAFATGENFADALTGAAYAAKKSIPIFLIPNRVDTSIQNYLIKNKTKSLQNLIVFGGDAILPDKMINDYCLITSDRTSLNEAQLIQSLNSALDLVKNLKSNNTINKAALDNLSSSLVVIDTRLNQSDFKYSENLVNVVKNTDDFLTSDFFKNMKVDEKTAEAFYGVCQALNYLKSDLEMPYSASSKTVYVREHATYVGQTVLTTPRNGWKSIQVKYGINTYGVDSQEEYDAIQEAIMQARKSVDVAIANGEYSVWNILHGYPDDSTPSAVQLMKDGYFDFSNMPISHLENLLKALEANRAITHQWPYQDVIKKEGKYAPSKTDSAYDEIFKTWDGSDGPCLSIAYAEQALFDAFGYNTRIRQIPHHAYCQFEVNGKWYQTNLQLGDQPSSHVSTMVSPTYLHY